MIDRDKQMKLIIQLLEVLVNEYETQITWTKENAQKILKELKGDSQNLSEAKDDKTN